MIRQVLELALPADTERLGRAVGELLEPGDVVVLSGPLGAGKTVLARGIGAGLGIRGPVTSPTFVIAREHPALPGGRGVPLVHVDAYRIGGLAELDDLDLDTDLLSAAVVVEWGEGMAERLADEHLLIRLRRCNDDSRIAELCGPARLLPAMSCPGPSSGGSPFMGSPCMGSTSSGSPQERGT